LTFLIAFVVYLMTLCRSVYFGDSGELLAAAHDLGIPHPTGYPLYLLLVRGFAFLIPWGSFAFKANLFSALCAAVGAEVLQKAIFRVHPSRVAAIGGGLCLSFLSPIWSEATVARTYPLMALFSASMLYVMVRYFDDPRTRWWTIHNSLLGLSLANHLMALAHIPAFLAAVMLRRIDSLRDWKRVLLSLAAALPGLAIYLYLPLRAAQDPGLEFHLPVTGEQGPEFQDLSAWKNLKSYLLRDLHHSHHWIGALADNARADASEGLEVSPAGAKARGYARILLHHAGRVLTELEWVGLAFLGLGCWFLWRLGKARLIVALSLLWLFNLLPLAWHGAWWDIFLYPRYMTCGFVAIAFLAGSGGAALSNLLAQRSNLRLLSAPAPFVLPALLLFLHYPKMDRSSFRLAEDYGRALLECLPEGAQIFSGVDQALYPMLYLHQVERLRPDVEIVNPVQLRGDADLLLAVNSQRAHELEGRTPRRLFTPDWLSEIPRGLERRRVGMVFEVVQDGAPRNKVDSFEVPALRGIEDPERLDDYSASVAAEIEASIADAREATGDPEGALARLRRVAQIRARRPWGCVYGALVARKLFTLQSLTLARTLLENAREWGDPEDRSVDAMLVELGDDFRRLAQDLRSRDPATGELAFRNAAELVPADETLQRAYVQFLVNKDQPARAQEHLKLLIDRYPRHRDKLKRLTAELLPQ